MLSESMLRTGFFLRKYKKFLPYIFIISLLGAVFLTHPFTIIRSGGLLTIICLFMFVISVSVRWLALRTDAEHLPEYVEAKGIYSIVRNPLYISNFLVVLSLSLYMGIIWYFVFVSFLTVFITERIVMHKENCQQNKYNEAFKLWSKTTGAVLPYLLNWQGASGSKSYFYTLRRMSLPVTASLGAFTLISFIKNRVIEFSNTVSIGWLSAFIIALALHLILLNWNKLLQLRKNKYKNKK